MIAVRGLRKSYGDHEVVRGIDFDVRRGEVLAVLGPNGAGKTTTVEILEGFRRSGLTVRECLSLYAGYYHAPRAVEDTLALVGLQDQADSGHKRSRAGSAGGSTSRSR